VYINVVVVVVVIIIVIIISASVIWVPVAMAWRVLWLRTDETAFQYGG